MKINKRVPRFCMLRCAGCNKLLFFTSQMYLKNYEIVCKNCYVLMNGQRSNYNKSKIKWVKNE